MNNKNTLKKILKYIDKYKYYLFLSMLLAVISVALVLYAPILVGRAIDCIIGVNNVDFDSIFSILIKLAAVIGATAVLQWIMNVCNNKITYNVSRDMRKRAFEKIESLPCSYLDAHPKGDIVSRVVTDVDQLADGLLMGFTQFFTGIVTIIGTLAFMLSINVWITIVVIVVTPLSFFIARFIAKKTYKMFSLQAEARGEQTSFIDEMVSNQKIADAYNMDNENLERFDEINNRLSEYSLKATFFSSITNPATRFVNSIVYAAVALFGALFAINGGGSGITVGILSCFLSYANQYTKPFNEISSVVTELQNALACASRVFELIEEKSIEPDKDNASVLTSPLGNIDIEDMSFSYSKDKELIKNLNLNVKAGMVVAIVGPTGCGKTTLINLLMRFYDADTGQIKIDGICNKDITRQSLRHSFGMVLQDTWLKSGTISDNIRLANPDASDSEVIEAAKLAHSHSFIKRLPNGYDTVIGEDGGSLSQGQKQLLCITRLMLNPPSMLILDEATSSIDTRTEIKIQKAFNKLMQGRTTFIVAHRLSTIKNADIILVMDSGNIVEQGSHDELFAKKGFYYNLYNSQFPKEM
ncbi:MAG: ABC transporter ATP-binding protein/permease [Acetobacter sp.]|nr:ABC transporter ATP-binding protein/permease [Bacteroides sp.]MCM1341445.1 ABC transporter ATP-binding protein/permease [Acetobacter sp.]MCM1433397.1 ABC transporter ATP-binding protein/permease [Clostridiales bacterium]